MVVQDYLEPQAREHSGLTEAELQLSEAAVQALIRSYCRESGVRNLQKHIEKVTFHLRHLWQ